MPFEINWIEDEPTEEELEAANDMYEGLKQGTFYQKELEALEWLRSHTAIVTPMGGTQKYIDEVSSEETGKGRND